MSIFIIAEVGSVHDGSFGNAKRLVEAAADCGATVIEKHFTFSRRMYGSDAAHSLEPAEFRGMAEGLRAVETMLSSHVDKSDASRYGDMKRIFEKSLVTVTDVGEGAVLTRTSVGIKKPGTGLPAGRLAEVVGRRAARPLPTGTLLREEDIDWS